MQTPTPLNGNAVFTTTTLTFIVGAVIAILRYYGHQIGIDQENALMDALRGPVGDLIVAVVLWIGARVSFSHVYSILSVQKLTGKVEPTVP